MIPGTRLRDTSAVDVGGGTRRRAGSASDADADAPDARLTPVAALVRRSPVTCEPDTPVAEAAARMATERVSCLLVPMRGAWGIVTDRDLRTRVVAVGAAGATALETIATFPARTIPQDALAGEALLAMFAQGVHHLPVTDRAGEIVGVVTDTDLMGLGRHTPFALKSQIERAATVHEVAAAGHDLPHLVVTMVRARADPIDVGRVVALEVDSMTRRLLDLAIEELGDAPVRLGLARPRQRRAPRAGAAHRSGSRPRARGRPRRGRSVLRRRRRASDGGTRGRRHPPMSR